MITIFILIFVATLMVIAERVWPNEKLSHVPGWWQRIFLLNVIQATVVLLAGMLWEKWMQGSSLFHFQNRFSDVTAAFLAYFISTGVYYFWHRYRHESDFFWRVCHQLHHSANRIEVLTSFYKHPVEILMNSWIATVLLYPILGCTPMSALIYTYLIALAEYFYHWNVKTPHWLGYFFQRPESHRVHHQRNHHTQNFADLPLWDMIFGSFYNPQKTPPICGFQPEKEDRFDDMLAFRDVHAPDIDQKPPVQLLPICFGCSKRWKCQAPNS